MALIYRFDSNGGFRVGDTETGHTAYAFPTSANATMAKRAAGRVAAGMMFDANAFAAAYPGVAVVANYDCRMWPQLLA